MTAPFEPFVAANNASVDALLALASAALSSAETINLLNLSAASTLLETGMANTNTKICTKKPLEALTETTSQVQPAFGHVVAYNRSLYEISWQTNDDAFKQIEAQLAIFQSHISGLVVKASNNAPAGSRVALAAVKSALDAAYIAFGNTKNVVKQAAEFD